MPLDRLPFYDEALMLSCRAGHTALAVPDQCWPSTGLHHANVLAGVLNLLTR